MREEHLAARLCTWRRSVAAEMKAIGLTWPETKRRAQDRANWRRTVDALCPTAGT
ncbi:hypothetical protein RR46_11438 [Papilio xuthus]|uniref:Uncharacterized protein n=1 Tax=Papilio xuthus TaxID=66420 RepID=A0A194PX55_PAPXU|nr:hypothetical protein RR46_11438 [Papilio xuthus]